MRTPALIEDARLRAEVATCIEQDGGDFSPGADRVARSMGTSVVEPFHQSINQAINAALPASLPPSLLLAIYLTSPHHTTTTLQHPPHSGLHYERELALRLRALGLPFEDEETLRARGLPKTPDARLLVPLGLVDRDGQVS